VGGTRRERTADRPVRARLRSGVRAGGSRILAARRRSRRRLPLRPGAAAALDRRTGRGDRRRVPRSARPAAGAALSVPAAQHALARGRSPPRRRGGRRLAGAGRRRAAMSQLVVGRMVTPLAVALVVAPVLLALRDRVGLGRILRPLLLVLAVGNIALVG